MTCPKDLQIFQSAQAIKEMLFGGHKERDQITICTPNSEEDLLVEIITGKVKQPKIEKGDCFQWSSEEKKWIKV